MLAPKTLVFTLACVFMAFAMSQTILAQNTAQDYINAHNKARTAVGAGLSNVSWNNTVYTYAYNYANQRKADCQLIHSPSETRPYGENLFGGPGDWSAIDAVNLWVSEKSYYDYSTNTCASGKVCGHYTQVVWRSSTQIGCAKVVCDNNKGVFIICSYYPPGNYIGQKPY